MIKSEVNVVSNRDILKSLLTDVYNDKEFIDGVLHLAETEEHYKLIIDLINKRGRNMDPDEISVYALELDKQKNSQDYR